VTAGETRVSDSGGTMVLLTGPTRSAAPDLAVLEPLRLDPGEPTRPAGTAPFLPPGEVLTYRYGLFAQVLRVVRDDERGLVAWLPAGSEQLTATPRDGRGLRERPLADRARLFAARDYDLWLDVDGSLWLKDEDELVAAVEGGAYTSDQVAAVREIAEQARHELVVPSAWPLDEGWEAWRPPPEWDRPLTFDGADAYP